MKGRMKLLVLVFGTVLIALVDTSHANSEKYWARFRFESDICTFFQKITWKAKLPLEETVDVVAFAGFDGSEYFALRADPDGRVILTSKGLSIVGKSSHGLVKCGIEYSFWTEGIIGAHGNAMVRVFVAQEGQTKPLEEALVATGFEWSDPLREFRLAFGGPSDIVTKNPHFKANCLIDR